ncbi:MAG: hypothetical protein D4R63_02215 [Methylococcaceae bacterium]|nr:MAG: hypothetical protein D4R63_02215 [Methylococcaceae bacterium]
MFELLFVLTTIFVASIFYQAVNNQKQEPINTHTTQANLATTVRLPETPILATKSPAPKTAKPGTKKESIKNPLTGEIATIASNYRFTKRWIKEALVTEGLLSKVYKNNELNEETEVLIKTAVLALESLNKYQL